MPPLTGIHTSSLCGWVKGTMEFRIGNENRTMKPGDVAVVPGGIEHEAYFPEDSEAIDFFAPLREDFLTGTPPSYMAQPEPGFRRSRGWRKPMRGSSRN